MKKVLLFLIIVAIGGAVCWFIYGEKLQNYYEEPGSTSSAPIQEKRYKLLVGKRFPTVELLTIDSKKLSTADLLNTGKVFLFLEPGCNLCEVMIDKWNGRVKSNIVSADDVVGITFLRPAQAEAYRKEREMRFSMFCDTSGVFLRDHDVTEFPLQVVVGKSGTIYEHTFDTGRQVFPDQLRSWLQK